MKITQAIILAAGFGTRMGKVSAHTPKALLRLAGRPLLDHIIAALREMGMDKIVVTAHAHAAQIIAHLQRTAPDILVSDERNQLMNTGGGAVKGFSLLRAEPFFTHNCDSIFPEISAQKNIFKSMAKNFNPEKMDALLLLTKNQSGTLSNQGDFFLDDDGRAAQNKAGNYIYTGVQILSPAVAQNPPDGAFEMDALWQCALSAHRLFGHVLTQDWLHTGTKQEFQEAESFLLSHPSSRMLGSEK